MSSLPEIFSPDGPLAQAIGGYRVRQQQVEQLRERSGQFEREIEGLTAQVDAKKREAALIAVELGGVQELYSKNLVPITRLSQLQREAARLDGESGALIANIAKARGQIAEINLQLLSIDQKVPMNLEVMPAWRAWAMNSGIGWST